MEEKQEGFEVVDRRRVSAEEEAGGPESAAREQPAPEAAAPEGEPAGEEAAAPEAEPGGEEAAPGQEGMGLPDVSIQELLLSFVGMLQGFVAQKMGLVPSHATGKVEADLEQARIAMNTVRLLAGQLETAVDPAIGRELQGLQASFIAMLRDFAWQKMGFVANRATGQIETDLLQAKAAIDAAQAIFMQVEENLPDAEVRELRRIMMDLQMNYVRKAS